MPTYFFYLDEDGFLVRDDEGQDLLNVGEAHARAIKSARDVLAAEILAGRWPSTWKVHVEDAGGRRLLTVPFLDAFEVC